MKTLTKRILTFALAAILTVGLFSFTACNKSEPDYDLVTIGDTIIAPLSLYSYKVNNLAELKALAGTDTLDRSKAIKIGIPDDGTNLARAIKLLETAGLIEVDPEAGYTPEMKHITGYLYNVEVIPTKADTLPSLLNDYAACTINGTFATSLGLSPSKDALIVESQGKDGDNPYVNIIAARAKDKDNETYTTIVEAFQTAPVAVYMLEKYKEAYFPAFEYEAIDQTPEELVAEIDAYVSEKADKTVVKVGVCGASNDHWKAVQKVLDDQNAGIYIELVEFSAYNIPNQALANGEIDLNSFQHKAYLAKELAQFQNQ